MIKHRYSDAVPKIVTPTSIREPCVTLYCRVLILVDSTVDSIRPRHVLANICQGLCRPVHEPRVPASQALDAQVRIGQSQTTLRDHNQTAPFRILLHVVETSCSFSGVSADTYETDGNSISRVLRTLQAATQCQDRRPVPNHLLTCAMILQYEFDNYIVGLAD